MSAETLGPQAVVEEAKARAAWLEGRRGYLGSSDAAALLNMDDQGRTLWQVWESKVFPPKAEGEPAADLRRGNRQERAAIERFIEVTGATVRVGEGQLLNPEYPCSAANLDGRVLELPAEIPIVGLTEFLEGEGVLEVKCPRTDGYYSTKSEGVSKGKILQVQHQLAVTGLQWALWVIYTPEYDDVFYFPILRDDELIRKLMQIEQVFWTKYVETRTQPPVPKPVALKFADVPGEAEIREDPQWRVVARDLVVAKFERVQNAAEIARCEGLLKELAGDSKHVSGYGVTLKEKQSNGRRSWQGKRYAAAVKLIAENEQIQDDEAAREMIVDLDPDAPEFWKAGTPKTSIEISVHDTQPHEVVGL